MSEVLDTLLAGLLALALAFGLAVAFWPAVASAQPLDDAVTGGYSPIASRYQWGSTGGDWPIPPNATAPVVDCRGDFRSGSCGPTTFVASGTPGLASTYWRPGGGATAGSGVAFDGSDDFLDAGDVGDQAGDFTVCVRLTDDGTAGRYVVSKYSPLGGKSWTLYRGAGFQFFVCKDDASCTSINLSASVTAGASNVVCAAYDYATDGTSILRGNVAGVAPAEVTNAVGPPQNVAKPLRIGAPGDAIASSYFDGSISDVKVWSGWAASAAQLAAMVRSQYAAQGSMGEPLTVTRASSKSCSIGGAWFTVPSNTPCIGDAGLSVEGSRTQYALANCTAPADQTVTLAAGAHTLWLEGTGTVAAAVGTATATGLPCTATAAAPCSFTVTVGGTVALDAEGVVTRFQVENGARSSLICATTTPVTRAADFPVASHGISSDKWCVRWAGVPDGVWARPSSSYLWALGAASGANRAFAYTGPSVVVFSVTDGSGGDKYVTAAHNSATGPAVWTACDDAGVLSLYRDDTLVSGAATGAGSGAFGTLPVGLTIGAAASGAAQIGGSISGVTTCNTSVASECQ